MAESRNVNTEHLENLNLYFQPDPSKTSCILGKHYQIGSTAARDSVPRDSLACCDCRPIMRNKQQTEFSNPEPRKNAHEKTTLFLL